MLSRATAQIIGEAYERRFSAEVNDYQAGKRRVVYRLLVDVLYDFLFDQDYEPWFINTVKQLNRYGDKRCLKELIMRLHTGESVAAATPNWKWDQRAALGQRMLRDLAKDILGWYESAAYGRAKQRLAEKIPILTRRLELDGYTFRDGELLFSEAAVLDVEEERGILEDLVSELALANQPVMKQHLVLSETHYVEGKWTDSIANARSFLESVLREIAAKHCLASTGQPMGRARYESPSEVRDYLAHHGLIAPKEKAAIAAVYGLLSATGAHPYIAEKDQARLMRYLALTFAQFALLRLQGALAS